MNGKIAALITSAALVAGAGLAACGGSPSSSAPSPTHTSAPTTHTHTQTPAAIPQITTGHSGTFVLDQPQQVGGSNKVTVTLNQIVVAKSATLPDGTVDYPRPNAGAGYNTSPNSGFQWVVVDVTVVNHGMVKTDSVSGVQPVNTNAIGFQWIAEPSKTVSAFAATDIEGDTSVSMAVGVPTQTNLTNFTSIAQGQQASGEYTFSTPAGRGNLEILNNKGLPVAVLVIK
jgi:hypothetical protein